MAFVVSTSQSYPWPVRVEEPDEERPGKKSVATFDGKFKKLTRSRISEVGSLLQGIRDDPAAADAATSDLIAEVLVGWDGVNDEKGEPIPFSEKVRDQMAQNPHVAAAILDALAESIQREKARRKN